MAPHKSTIVEVLARAQRAAEAESSSSNSDDAATAHQELLKEIHNLRLAAETPTERMMRQRFQFLQALCVRMALEWGLLQEIAARKGQMVSARTLSEKTGADELVVTRIMRLVTYIGYCDEEDHACYASNETTEMVVQLGYTGGEKHFTDLGYTVGSKLVDIIRQNAFHAFPEGPDQKNAFQHTFGMSIFEYLQHNEEQKVAFDNYMSVRRSKDMPQWFETFPAERELPVESLKKDADAVLVVDIGGSKGHEMIGFHKRFPQLPGRLVNQDLPETIAAIEPKPEGVECVAHDFFTAQRIKGARIYYLRSILHDWSDARCQSILSNIVPAMEPAYSRILIDDFVLPNTNAPMRPASMDVLMMLYASGIERTQAHWKRLLDSVGLDIVKVWTPKIGEESVIEVKMKGSG